MVGRMKREDWLQELKNEQQRAGTTKERASDEQDEDGLQG
jgi:hypothetical protein